jgi:hypothetical protein
MFCWWVDEEEELVSTRGSCKSRFLLGWIADKLAVEATL